MMIAAMIALGVNMEVILENHWSGLGDWLSMSTLPEELTVQKGYDVYLNSKSVFRNEEIKELFLKNPYIKGIKEGLTNAGDVPGRTPAYQNLTGNHIHNWEVLHGLEPKNTYAKIYYEPKKLYGYQDVVLIDTTSITEQYDLDKVREAIDVLKEYKFTDHQFFMVKFPKQLNAPQNDRFHGGRHLSYATEIDQEVEITSIFHYCDQLANIGGFISLHSGAHTLASAIKNQFNPGLENICIIRKENYDRCAQNGLFIFPNVEYATIEG
jgi:hypothetical protein